MNCSMDKAAIVKSILAQLELELRRQHEANAKASAGATDAESRAESKWDTGGLEASYLARGYAKQFALLSSQSESLRGFVPASFSGKSIALGALAKCDFDGHPSYILLLNCCGGHELIFEGHEITVVTPESPLGAALMNKREGDRFALPNGATGLIAGVE